MPPDEINIDDQQTFEALDRYVAALQAGDATTCKRWLNEYPQLRQLADCVAALDQFSLPGKSRSTPPAVAGLAETFVLPGIFGAPATGGGGGGGDAPAPSGEFGKYELLDEIGRGGMGVVFKARQRDLNRVVALKMILANRLAGGEDVRRFYREARAAGSLRHPHIVGIHEVGEIHGQHYFAMDFISGTSLAGVTKFGPLDPERAARCLVGVARAVQYLHDHGIVHRDLKPSNILLDADDAPYVTDFGLARVFGDQDERTQSGAILGTPGYMSPEQAAGRISAVSERSDVYSLGAILYETLTGRPPFREDNPLNTILQVLEGEPTLPTALNLRVPPELERICLKCLEKDPDRRYQSAAAIADELDRYLRREPIEARSAGIADRFRRWVRRETGFAARLAIMAAAVGIVEVVYLVDEGPWPNRLGVRLAFALWALLAVALQWLLRQEKTAELARVAWAVTDPVLLFFILKISPDNIGPILIGYPVLIAASGLWFSERLVAVSTIACLMSFAVLFHMKAEDLTMQWQYPVIFMASLAVIGFMVGFQVHRVRTLNRYFEQARPPDA